jgi:type IV secretory pathway VirB9-like protein
MKKQITTAVLILSSFARAIASGPAKALPPAVTKRAADTATQWAGDDAPAIVAELTARAVHYGERDVVPVKTKVRYTTLIILPKDEQILDFTCGDKEFWVVNGNQNFAYVKPAKAGATTNLNLVTASGNIYSFFLSEVSETPKVAPDLKIFIDLKDDAMQAAARSAPRFVPAQDVESYKREAERARQDVQKAKETQLTLVQQGINRFVSNVRFPYRFEAGKKPFSVRAMYNDDRFTYIQARPEETPTLYEIKDGKPNLINFTYKDGLYVVDKILGRGYLAIGKQKLEFTRED